MTKPYVLKDLTPFTRPESNAPEWLLKKAEAQIKTLNAWVYKR